MSVEYLLIPYLSAWLRTKPSTAADSIMQVPACMKGEKVGASSEETQNGWVRIDTPRSGWIYGTYLKKISETPAPKPADKPVVPTPKPPPIQKVETENMDEISSAGRTITGTSNAAYRKLCWRYIRAFGCPAQFSSQVDIPYTDEITPDIGRVFAKTMLSNPTILSICPGTVDYMPGFSGVDKGTFLDGVKAQASGDSDLLKRIKKDDGTNKLNGKLYAFKQDYNAYMKVVNVLCRSCSMFLGIGDETIPWGSKSLKHFDYSWWTSPDEQKSKPGKSVFGPLKEASKALGSAVGDDTYVHFFITQQGSSISENISTSVASSMLEEAINGQGLSKIGRNLEFLFGGPVGAMDIESEGGFSQDLDAIFNGGKDKSGFIGSFGKIAANYLKGGRMIFPQMIDDVRYDKSISCAVKFISPYGNKLSIFLRCYVPIMHLLAMALPKQLAENMYTYPFLIRVFQKGWFNCDLAAMTELEITRGGQDETGWTIEGLATEWDAKFTVTPLYSQLMVSSTQNPFLFMQNTSLVEYLATMCGVDLKENNLSMKMEIAAAMIENSFMDIPTNLARGIGESLARKVQGIFQIQNA